MPDPSNDYIAPDVVIDPGYDIPPDDPSYYDMQGQDDLIPDIPIDDPTGDGQHGHLGFKDFEKTSGIRFIRQFNEEELRKRRKRRALLEANEDAEMDVWRWNKRRQTMKNLLIALAGYLIWT